MLYENLLLLFPSLYNHLKPFLKFQPPYILTPRLLNFGIFYDPLSIRTSPVYLTLESNEKDLQDLSIAINDEEKRYGMEMNVMKTKTMLISRSKQTPKINISIEGKPIEQVEKMVYLGHVVTETGKGDTEIKRRIAIARSSFTFLYKVLTSREVSLDTRIRLLKCYIWSTLLYGCETWALSKIFEKRIEAFEIWTFRRILKISYLETLQQCSAYYLFMILLSVQQRHDLW